MREQLTQYVNLLFAGTQDTDEIRAEILQNTLDRYDDLIEQGKAPEAAYRLAIGGIGDVNEILGTIPATSPSHAESKYHPVPAETESEIKNKKLRAIGIAMYIICAIPLFILCDLGFETIGLSLTIILVACATYLMIITGKKDSDDEEENEPAQDHEDSSPRSKLKEGIGSLIWAIGLAVYFILSFSTSAWHITWIVFPIIGCTEGLVKAIMDLIEDHNHEK